MHRVSADVVVAREDCPTYPGASISRAAKAGEESSLSLSRARARDVGVARAYTSTRDVRTTLLDGLESREEEFGARSGRGPTGRSFSLAEADSRLLGRTSRNVSSHSRTLSLDVFTISQRREASEREERERERRSPPDAPLCASARLANGRRPGRRRDRKRAVADFRTGR